MSFPSPRRAGLSKIFTWLSLAGLLVSLGAVSMGCSGQNMKDPDNDEKKEKARPFKTTEPTKDRMDDNSGDREDWRYWTAEKDGTGEVRVEVSKWEDSTTLTAMVTVFDEAGTRLIEKPMNQSSNPKIQEQFPVESGRKYFARFKLVSGKGEYIAEMSEPLDPCAACTDKQVCEEGKCVDKPCGGDCPEGKVCDKAKNECVKLDKKPENKCEGVECPKGEICQRATGRCVVPAPRAPDTTEPAKPAGIDCSVIDARDAAGGSLLTLSAGENRGVKKGMSGSVAGVKGATFKVTEVYPSRCKAVCKVPAAKLSGQTKASIKP